MTFILSEGARLCMAEGGAWQSALSTPLRDQDSVGRDDCDVADSTGWPNVLSAAHGAPLSYLVASVRRRSVGVARLPIRGLPKMKAGSAGSNPDGVIMEEKKIHSQPFQILLRDIGEAVFTLNTAVVGLDAVENGHQKPANLNISWEPQDRKIAARKSRKFILESVMVRVSEVINQFVSALSKLAKFKDEKAEGGNDTSMAEKVAMIATKVLEQDDYLIPGVVLLVHWRNRIVHLNSKAELKPQQRQILLNNKDIIVERYRGLDISKLLNDFENQRPTLKDVSSLISMTISLARKIDRTMQQNITKDELDAWLDHYQLLPMLKKIKAETSPHKYRASICRLFMSQTPYLLDAYLVHYDSSPPSRAPF